MALDKDQLWETLDSLWADGDVKVLPTRGKKLAIVSDTHMGNGREADNFHDNLKAFVKALDYYDRNEYTLILLGDIEELWQFDLVEIVRQYGSDIYSRIKTFNERGVHRIFGNHDLEWGGIWDPTRKEVDMSVFASEALKLRDHKGDVRFMLVHGHQGSPESDKYTWFSRFWVRMFRFVEPLTNIFGLFGNKSATQSSVTKDFEKTFYSWAKSRKVILVLGHSHRAIFASKSYAETLQEQIADLKEQKRAFDDSAKRREIQRQIDEKQSEWEHEKERDRVIDAVDPGVEPLPCYFNSGCGLYTDGMTALEIDDDNIRLVKWDNHKTVGNQYRDVLVKGLISDLVRKVEASG
ncbi:MAG: metallophosphoesterase family protein [Anaerolineales bacterium]|jgi:UDP-2,3-diacylglucosamine pyrophosphatase LpxH